MRLVQLSRHSIAFPSPEGALREPNGLLALGGDLSPARLLMAYQRGIFPWFSPGDPILWWSPDPRAVLWPESLHISRSMKRFHKRSPYRVTMNYAFWSGHRRLCQRSRRRNLDHAWRGRSLPSPSRTRSCPLH
ncbi:leucyl/phenylalanyl-tRNA-protein transferase [Escherichia coli]|uniref:Leucyl/phenylalanyl-tRNA--protein transferase n=1 Tax=Escherichia coli TaxID=562 RepID=A0A377KAY8_ECOLX|nr:leucyl/phenylalanyl-tRNA-protein transferase [Escherichia coli]